MKPKTICVGVDRGFGYTKYYSDIATGQVDSLVAPISESRAKELAINNADDKRVIILKEENNFYLVGPRVADVEPEYAQRNLARGRDNTNERILFMTAMGLSSAASEYVKAYITTGLPTDEFEKNREEYKSIIKNGDKNYVFSLILGGKEFKKKIEVAAVSVENQPRGTIATIIENKLEEGESWDNIRSRRFAVCDIGYNTTDSSVYVGKDIVGGGERVNFSTTAMSKVIDDAKTVLESKYNCKKSENDILASLSTGTIKVRGKVVEVGEDIKEVFEKNAEKLTEEMSSRWDQFFDVFDEIVLTGGAVANKAFAKVLKAKFSKKFDWDVSVMENPQLANACGFYHIASTMRAKEEPDEE